MSKYNNTINQLINKDILKTPKIIKAFKKVNRKAFMPDELKEVAHIDNAMPIGHGQTISQPLTVAIMLEILEPKQNNKILEIGYGSGWVTCILSEIISSKGKIYAYEIVKEIAKFGKKNIHNFYSTIPENIVLHNYDYERDYLKNAPYDRIISAASFQKTPSDIADTLSEDGIFVFPTEGYDIRRVSKQKGKLIEERLPGFIFVPITH